MRSPFHFIAALAEFSRPECISKCTVTSFHMLGQAWPEEGEPPSDYRPDPALRAAQGPRQADQITCRQVDGKADDRWEKDFPWSIQAKRLLQDFFGSRDFRSAGLSA